MFIIFFSSKLSYPPTNHPHMSLPILGVSFHQLAYGFTSNCCQLCRPLMLGFLSVTRKFSLQYYQLPITIMVYYVSGLCTAPPGGSFYYDLPRYVSTLSNPIIWNIVNITSKIIRVLVAFCYPIYISAVCLWINLATNRFIH